MNSVSARQAGITDAEIEAIDAPDSELLSSADKAAIRLATVLSNAMPQGRASEALIAELQRHFGDGQIIEMAMTCAILVGMDKMLFALNLADFEAPRGTGA